MMDVRHYYHVFAAGAWSLPLREHVRALGRADFRGDMTVGLVGPAEDRARARDLILIRLHEQPLPGPVAWAEADEGFEQVTLRQVHRDVQETPGEYAVLYTHTKGALYNTPWNRAWRRSMTQHVVSGWRDCVQLLDDSDAVGCHWLTRDSHHDPQAGHFVTTPFFGGNFWMARASYLRTLPPPQDEHRHQAEEWIGLGNPRVHDLLPGWPSLALAATGEEASNPDKPVRISMKRKEWLWVLAELPRNHEQGDIIRKRLATGKKP